MENEKLEDGYPDDFEIKDEPFEPSSEEESSSSIPSIPQKKRIAILTNFQDFNPGYSLSGIVVDQCRMLLRHGHVVFLFVNQNFNPAYNFDAGLEDLQDRYPHALAVLKMTKFMHLRDYPSAMLFTAEHKQACEEASGIYVEEMLKRKVDVVFTHDFIFTGWNLPYAAAVKRTSEKLAEKGTILRWLHWIHSVPSNKRDWWNLRDYGPGHKIVFPNKTEVINVAESFSTNPSFIECIPHIKDIRTWYDFCQDSVNITYRYPEIMKADVLQVYPCSTDRLAAKQLNTVIQIFSEMKKISASCFLIIANQWATGLQRKEDISMYIGLAEHLGLKYGENFIFTSEITDHPSLVKEIRAAESPAALHSIHSKHTGLLGKKLGEVTPENLKEKIEGLVDKLQPFNKGVPRRIIRELQLISNLFIFPTREESFGLVGPEAAYSGALVVSNRSLQMMHEVLGAGTLSFDFGSHSQTCRKMEEEKEGYLRAIAMTVLNRMYNNESIFTKTYCRQRYNADNLYSRHYAPAIG